MLSDPDGTCPAANKLVQAPMILCHYVVIIMLHYGCVSDMETDTMHICPQLNLL